MEKKLLDFITEARKRGFSDRQIKDALVNHGWPVKIIDSAFQSLTPKFKSKNQICIFLSDELISILEKRGKKNMLNISEQIEDILRRSCLTFKGGKAPKPEKLDDRLVAIFSRQKKGKTKK